MGGKTGTTTGLALLLAAGMAWAGGASGGEGNRGLSPIICAQQNEIRTALFGDGTAAGSLIRSVAIGGTGNQTKLERIVDVLQALGVPPNVSTNGMEYNVAGHHNHFHLNIQPPTKKPIKIAGSILAVDGIQDRETSRANVADTKYRKIYSVCKNVVPVDHPDFQMANEIASASDLLLEGPSHGKLVLLPKGVYLYYPDANYLGMDQMVFSVSYKDSVSGSEIQEKVIYSVYVGKAAPEYGPCEDDVPKELHGAGTGEEQRYVSDVLEVPNGVDSDALATLHSFIVFSLEGDFLDGRGIFNFADLPNSSLGQTTNTTITLDTNAAGHGWYIDYTPYLNEEFLPTSNPYEWIAKEGTEAYGKMDLVSVLWHEYGHAMGLDHSSDSHDLMAATLTPGVRRLPSADTLAEFRRMLGYSLAADTNQPTTPTPADVPHPDGPLPPNNGSVRVTRARITRNGTFVTGEDGIERDAAQSQAAANPTLTDPRLQTGTGWETTGSVSLGNGAAILTETATSQTRLNQAFIVGEHDRYLTFTLAGIALDDVNNAPDDAFEAALLDANTGLSLLGGTGLTRNDAFLNLQADGTERAGQGVTYTPDADWNGEDNGEEKHLGSKHRRKSLTRCCSDRLNPSGLISDQAMVTSGDR